MTLNSILSTSLSGLSTNQEAIRTTSGNIANVNTEGYNRLQVQQQTKILEGGVAGVEIGEVRRIVDTFLETSYRTATSNTEEYAIQRVFHDRFQGFLGDPSGDGALSNRIDEVFQRLSELSLAPADVLRRQSALSEIDSFLLQTSSIGDQLQLLRADASQQIVDSVSRANEAMLRIFEINPLLVRENAIGGETGGLEQRLAEALNDLSKELDIKVVENDNGDVSVFTNSGQSLVSLTAVNQLYYDAPGIVTAETLFPLIQINRVDPDTVEEIGTRADFDQNVRSGTLRGLLDLRDDNLVDLTETVGELSARFQDSLNAIHNQYSAVPAPNSLEGRAVAIAGDNSLNFTGEVTFAVVNSDNTLDTSVAIDFDLQTINGTTNTAAFADFDALIAAVNTALGGAGTLALSDGVMSLTAADTTDGVVVHDSLTDPSRRAGRGFSHFFGMNDMIVADSLGIFEPGIQSTDAHNITNGEAISFTVRNESGQELTTATISIDTSTNTTYGDFVSELNDTTTGLGNYFTFALDSSTGALTATPVSSTSDNSFSVLSDTTQIGSTGFSIGRMFGLSEGSRTSAARDIQVKDALKEEPELLALAIFDTTATGTAPVMAAGDQRGALALQNLQTALVTFSPAGELTESNVTIPQYVARLLGNAGTIAERLTNLESDNESLQFEIAQRQSDYSGVNLDEELANLVIYQNAYGAAARVLTSVQELYDSLLAAV